MGAIEQFSPRAEGVIGGMRELINTLRGRIVELEAKVAMLERALAKNAELDAAVDEAFANAYAGRKGEG